MFQGQLSFGCGAGLITQWFENAFASLVSSSLNCTRTMTVAHGRVWGQLRGNILLGCCRTALPTGTERNPAPL